MSNQLATYVKQDAVIQEFAEVLGDRQARSYIRSVLIAVANNEALQNCSPTSIITSAMRAATLNLSCDPSLGLAYLVPFKGKATLIIGYKGLQDLALRTGKYRYMNVAKIYEGEEIIEDRMTGLHTLGGGKKSNVIVGWLLYFQLTNGFTKTFYMTTEEIHQHAARYSKSYAQPGSPWKTNTGDMERKTVLRLGLSKWGYFNPHDASLIEQVDESTADGEDEYIDGEAVEAQQPEPRQKSENELMAELGFDVPNVPEPATSIEIDLAHLAGVCNSDGIAYIMLDPEKLADMSIGIGKVLAKNGLTDEKKAEYGRKQAAIGEILAWHKNH